MTTSTHRHRAARGNCLVKLLVGLLILTFGFIAGGVTASIIVSNQMMETLRTPESYPAIATNLMEGQYDLQPDQTEQIRALFHQRFNQGIWLARRTWPIVEASLDHTADEIRAILNEKQTEQFNADYQRARETWLKRPEKPANMPEESPLQFMAPIFQRLISLSSQPSSDAPVDPPTDDRTDQPDPASSGEPSDPAAPNDPPASSN